MPSGVVIQDADGGMQVELRAGPVGGQLPVFSAPSGDTRADWNEKIDSSSSGDLVIHAVAADKTFHVEEVVLTLKNAGSVIFKSEATKISGSMYLGAGTVLSARQLGVSLAGRVRGDDFVIFVSGDAVVFPVIGGYAVGYDD